MDSTIETQILEARAQAGETAAQIALGRQHDGTRNDLARDWFARAARQGDLTALRLLGINLLMQAPSDIGNGVAMIRDAADRGDTEAAHFCAVLAGQDVQLADRWGVALHYLQRAAGQGHGLARDQLRLLADGGSAVDPARWTAPAAARTLFDAPRLSVAEGFLSAAECDWLMARARPHLRKAEVYDPGGGGGLRADDIRSNSVANFSLAESDLVMILMRERAARWTGLHSDFFEPPSVLHYNAGEQFMQHYDFIDPQIPQLVPDLQRHGQRWATLLVYLNEDFEGGETAFPALDFRHRGKKGDALLFWNVTPDGQPDRMTLHAGLAPTSGEKWLLSQWMRRR